MTRSWHAGRAHASGRPRRLGQRTPRGRRRLLVDIVAAVPMGKASVPMLIAVHARWCVATPNHPLVLAWTTKDSTAAAGATALDVDHLRRRPATLARLRIGSTWLAVLVGVVLLVPVGISLLLAGTPLGGRALKRLLLGGGRRR